MKPTSVSIVFPGGYGCIVNDDLEVIETDDGIIVQLRIKALYEALGMYFELTAGILDDDD